MRADNKKIQGAQISTMAISVPPDFNFWRTVISHGWTSLQPFHLDIANRRLLRVLDTSKQIVLINMCEAGNLLEIQVRSHDSLIPEETRTIHSKLETVFRLNETLDSFFTALIKKGNNHFGWIPQVKAGRILRGPDLFEDVVKMMCTTNCTWSATQRMVNNLVSRLGNAFNEFYSEFPTPTQLASTSEAFLYDQVRCGYRSPYILQFARSVASGSLNLERWNSLDSESLYNELISIKGIGPYAAGNLMRLLGHNEHLALDSWCRQRYSRLYKKGRKVSDKTILNHYKQYGQWKGLVMWLDLTKEWFEDEGSNPI